MQVFLLSYARRLLDVYEDQNVWDNDYLVKIHYPEADRNIPTVPIQFESEPAPVYTPSDKLGSSTVAVMKDLGYTDEQIEAAMLMVRFVVQRLWMSWWASLNPG